VIAPARLAAYRALRAIASGRADLGHALSRARDPLRDLRDRALATELATGTLRWRGAIDYQLQHRSARPLGKLDEAVLDALRLGGYQLLYLHRIPVSAIVNDSVELTKGGGFRSAAPFVNAILRRLARERASITWPDRSDTSSYLSVVHSHPHWLVERWLARYGEEIATRWLTFNNHPPALTLATNRLRGTRAQLAERLRGEGSETRPTTVAPHGLVVESGHPLASQAFRSGLFVVQDEASQIIPELLATTPGQRALDLCASPGGKTVAMAADSGSAGLVVATDVRAKRVQVLASTLARCGTANVRLAHVPQQGTLPFRDGIFDRVLVDAPCSGLGTVRRDPDIRWRRRPADLEVFAAHQISLLQRVRPIVRPGGVVVYSTCSSEPEENEAVVAAFLASATEFSTVPIGAMNLPDAIVQMRTPDGYLRTSPLFGLEAFFGAVLRKRDRE
jgi:16S rRNA (cytosine967-C5)-methyltransferase